MRRLTAWMLRQAALGAAVAVGWALVLAPGAMAGPGSVTFSTAPALPTLTGVTLNGGSQTTYTTMTDFAVSDTKGIGWNVTVNGQGGPGKNAVFKQYCPNPTCGTDSGPGYVAGGYTLPADSLTLNSTGASWTSGGPPTPSYQCNSGCFVDNATAVKIISSPTTVAQGTWTTTGWSATSLALSTPSTLRKLQTNEVYRVNVVWTVNTGP